MKHLVTIFLSVLVLSAAYLFTFGLPGQNQPTSAETNASAGAPSARPGPGGNRGNRASAVVLIPLEERSHLLTLRTIGSASSPRKSGVRSSETGEVTETALQANSDVSKGDVLLRLDDRSQKLAVSIAQAELEQARNTYERLDALRGRGNLTVSDVSLQEAEIAVRLAEANLGLAQVALDERTIVAPISGRLGLSDVQVGDWVSAGDVIVTIDDTQTLLAEFEVPERSIALLRIGQKVAIGTPTYRGRLFEGIVTGFDSRLDSVTRSATVQAEIDNSEGLLLSGMSFAVRMTETTETLPVVPATAITWSPEGAGIWTAENGRATRVPVTIRYRDGDQVWLETDLPTGSMIVSEGAGKLREGAQVRQVGDPAPRDTSGAAGS